MPHVAVATPNLNCALQPSWAQMGFCNGNGLWNSTGELDAEVLEFVRPHLLVTERATAVRRFLEWLPKFSTVPSTKLAKKRLFTPGTGAGWSLLSLRKLPSAEANSLRSYE